MISELRDFLKDQVKAYKHAADNATTAAVRQVFTGRYSAYQHVLDWLTRFTRLESQVELLRLDLAGVEAAVEAANETHGAGRGPNDCLLEGISAYIQATDPVDNVIRIAATDGVAAVKCALALCTANEIHQVAQALGRTWTGPYGDSEEEDRKMLAEALSRFVTQG